jgi:hypothetical protein
MVMYEAASSSFQQISKKLSSRCVGGRWVREGSHNLFGTHNLNRFAWGFFFRPNVTDLSDLADAIIHSDAVRATLSAGGANAEFSLPNESKNVGRQLKNLGAKDAAVSTLLGLINRIPPQ